MQETSASYSSLVFADLHAELDELRAQLAAKRQGEDWTQALLTHLQAGVLLCAADGTIRYVNPVGRRILGQDDLVGHNLFEQKWDLHHPDGRPMSRDELPVVRVLKTRQALLDCHLTLLRPDGAQRWVSVNAIPVLDGKGEVAEVAATFLDLTHDEMAMRAAALARESMTRFVHSAPIGICVTDETGVFEQVNPHYCDFYGYVHDELLGQHFTMVVPEAQKTAMSQLHDQFIRDGAEVQGEWQVVTRQGELKSVLADAVRITGDDGRPKKVTFIVDISQRARLEQALRRSNEELRHLAITDGLTGLYNRRHITARLVEELHRSQRYGTPLSIFLCDLDHFKQINDVYGHAVGDEALQAVAGMLRHELRDVDLIGRYGGEEFLVVLPNVDLVAARAVAERLRQAARELRFSQSELRLTLSAGVMQAMPEESAERLIQRADMCLYTAKSEGRDRICG